MKYRRVVAGAGAVALGIALAVAGVLPAQALGSRSAAKPGNIMVGGEHKVTAPTWGSVYFFRT